MTRHPPPPDMPDVPDVPDRGGDDTSAAEVLGRLDALDPLPRTARADAAIAAALDRHVTAASAAPDAPAPRRLVSRWLLTSSAAAAAVVAGLVWLGSGPDGTFVLDAEDVVVADDADDAGRAGQAELAKRRREALTGDPLVEAGSAELAWTLPDVAEADGARAAWAFDFVDALSAETELAYDADGALGLEGVPADGDLTDWLELGDPAS